MAEIKLKPCPFCGKDAAAIKRIYSSDRYYSYEVKNVVCENCGARTMKRNWDDEEAAADWNRRNGKED